MNYEKLKNELINDEKKCVESIKNGAHLYKLPMEARTTNVCLTAFEINEENIKYFPKDNPELFKEDICIKAIEKSVDLFYYIPIDYKTERVCFRAAEKDPGVLAAFPKNNPKLFTEDICIKAVNASASAFYFIIEEAKTPRVCIAAFNKSPLLVRYFPKDLTITRNDLILNAIEIDSDIFKELDDDQKTVEICHRSFELDYWNIKYFPKNNPDIFTEDVCLKAISFKPILLNHIPGYDKMSTEFYKKAICLNKQIIHYMPSSSIQKMIEEDIEFCKTLLKEDCMLIKDFIAFFPKDDKDLYKEEIILEGMRYYPDIIKFVPEEYITDKIRETYKNI